MGHGSGTDVPTEQKKPEGHRNPVGLSTGEGSEAPPMQTYPAAHGPVGIALPRKKNKSHLRGLISLFYCITAKKKKVKS